MIELLDYVQDYQDNFWIVCLIDDYYKGYMVYEVSSDGDRYNNITHKKYIKHIQSGYEIIPAFKRVFNPRTFYKENKDKLTGVWKDYVDTLNSIGITDDEIGIFGSFLVGFDIIKDVDFSIYGMNALKKYYENNELIKERINATFITEEHIMHQYNKHKNNYPKLTDLKEIISRNWSGVQIKSGVLSTPRFIDLDNQLSPKISEQEKVTIEITDGLTSVMLPRVAKCIFEGDDYKIITNLWKYQSFAKTGDVIECLASVDRVNKTLYISDYNCYIKYVKKSTCNI